MQENQTTQSADEVKTDTTAIVDEVHTDVASVTETAVTTDVAETLPSVDVPHFEPVVIKEDAAPTV